MSERTELRLVYAGILALCSVFWGGVVYAGMRLFS